jgi:hypothetical protein
VEGREIGEFSPTIHTIEHVNDDSPRLRQRDTPVRQPDRERPGVRHPRLGAGLAAQAAAVLVDTVPAGRARTAAGEVFTAAETGIVVEVLAGTTRHAVVTVTRVR